MKSNKLFILCSLSFGFSAFAGNMQIGIGASGTFQHSKRNRQQQAQQGVLIPAPIQVQQPTIPLDQVAAPQEQSPAQAPIVVQAPSVMPPLAPARGIAEQAPVKMDIHGSLPAVEAGPVPMPDIIADGSDIDYSDRMGAAARASQRAQFETRMETLADRGADDASYNGGDTAGCIVAMHSLLAKVCEESYMGMRGNDKQGIFRHATGKLTQEAWEDVFQGTFMDRTGTRVKGLGSTLRNLTPFRSHDKISYAYSRCGNAKKSDWSLDTADSQALRTADLFCTSQTEEHKELRLSKLLAALRKDLNRVVDRGQSSVEGTNDVVVAQKLLGYLDAAESNRSVKSVLASQQNWKDYGSLIGKNGHQGKIKRMLNKAKFWGDHSQDEVAPGVTKAQQQFLQSQFKPLANGVMDREIQAILDAQFNN
ncbi:MAG: hypothetical protein JST16_19145 [Bdellovibrionales bacterium]|nr:hypothetical protein [Bdellovibrionales bacterium]